MQPTQQRFWPDSQPLVERLGRDFFRNLPQHPGVYLMRDASEVVVYVGKAKNLRKRLGSYRVANPERMPRRHLRMLRAVVRIELQECADEQAALAREAELLRALKPRFNRAGTWPAKPRFLAWKTSRDAIELTVTESPEEGWNHFASMGVGAVHLGGLLARLLWVAMNRHEAVEGLPQGWTSGRVFAPVLVRSNDGGSPVLHEAHEKLSGLLVGKGEEFCQWIEDRRSPIATHFEQTWLAAELESVRERFKRPIQRVSSFETLTITER